MKTFAVRKMFNYAHAELSWEIKKIFQANKVRQNNTRKNELMYSKRLEKKFKKKQKIDF